MADTGSYPMAIDAAASLRTVARPAARHGQVKTVGLSLVGVLLVASGAAAAGINYEPEGYGALSIAAGAVLALATAVPLSLLFKKPSR
jgi:hypothetical protein